MDKEYDFKELEKAASDKGIGIPDGFGRELDRMIDSMDAAERIITSKRGLARRPATYIIGIAASVAVVAGLAFSLRIYRTPEDTFTDPVLAYAETEKALMMISDKMTSGTSKAAEAGKTMEKHGGIIENINKLF